MKKFFIILTFSILFVLGGGYSYYYYYVEEVTERFLVKTPKMEITPLYNYSNDVEAEKTEKQKAKEFRDKLMKGFSKEDVSKYKSDIEAEAAMNAYKSLLSQKWFIISCVHARSADHKKVLNIIKESGFNAEKLKEYGSRNKIKVSVYELI